MAAIDRPVFEVINPGTLSSVQDLGRFGYADLGISKGGAADPWALRLGNQLVRNSPSAAAIEMTMSGGSFRFHQDSWVALTGAHCTIRLNGHLMPMWYSFPVKSGETLNCSSIEGGLRVYLCVHGGIDVPAVLGSRSTLFTAGFGGQFGRMLLSGDKLYRADGAINSAGYYRTSLRVRAMYRNFESIRVTRGPQANWFSDEQINAFTCMSFRVTTDVNRQGLRLQTILENEESHNLKPSQSAELQTEGVSAGAIQIPPNGQPIILYCEQQTTGGYPKIANVIRADMYKIGQLRPEAEVRFREVEFSEAWTANENMERECRRSLNPA